MLFLRDSATRHYIWESIKLDEFPNIYFLIPDTFRDDSPVVPNLTHSLSSWVWKGDRFISPPLPLAPDP
jgi:hypothetical protein